MNLGGHPTQEIDSGLRSVFLAHRSALHHFLNARGGEDAEDLLQELWIKLAADREGPIADPLSYLFRMANNLVLDRHRSAQRRLRRETEWEYLASNAAGSGEEPPPDRTVVARENLRAVEAILAGLGQRTSAIFMRFRADGVGQRQIAEEQGISQSAVEKHLQKAYRALARLNADAETEGRQRRVMEGGNDATG